MKEEERKWAGEDNKADDVDVTLHLYQPSTRYMYFSIKRAEPTSTWYLIPQQNIPHLPKWGVGARENDIIINNIVNTWAPGHLHPWRTQFSIGYMFLLKIVHIYFLVASSAYIRSEH